MEASVPWAFRPFGTGWRRPPSCLARADLRSGLRGQRLCLSTEAQCARRPGRGQRLHEDQQHDVHADEAQYFAAPAVKSSEEAQTEGHPPVPSGKPTPWPELRARLHRLLSGWAKYFSFGHTSQADGAIHRARVGNGSGDSSAGGTSCASQEPHSSAAGVLLRRWVCWTSTRSAGGASRMPSREARQRDGCGRSASPVR